MCRPGRVGLHVALLRPAAERSDLTDLGSAARQQSQVSSPPVFIKPVFLFSFSLSLSRFLSFCLFLSLVAFSLTITLSICIVLVTFCICLSFSLSFCFSFSLSVCPFVCLVNSL